MSKLEELVSIALKEAKEHLEGYEYLSLLENEDLEHLSEDDFREIHSIITTKIDVAYPNTETPKS